MIYRKNLWDTKNGKRLPEKLCFITDGPDRGKVCYCDDFTVTERESFCYIFDRNWNVDENNCGLINTKWLLPVDRIRKVSSGQVGVLKEKLKQSGENPNNELLKGTEFEPKKVFKRREGK